MKNLIFKAMVVEERDGKFFREIKKRTIDELPEGEVLIRSSYSSLNYKDALSASGHKGITRKFPHTPGIDVGGIVAFSNDIRFQVGDEVLVTGYDLGMNTSGGFSEYVRVPASWVVKKPKDLTLRECIIYGTAGFTAGLCLYKMEMMGITPENSRTDILVTGASGGVGSLSIMLFNSNGYNVTASTGKSDKHKYLRKLGARKILSREDVDDKKNKPLWKEMWDGAIDTVGGNTLATVIKAIKYDGAVCSCGLTQNYIFESTVYPFILRSVNLLGIASAETPMKIRKQIWEKLAGKWKIQNLEDIVIETSLNELSEKIDSILEGKITGRVLVKV